LHSKKIAAKAARTERKGNLFVAEIKFDGVDKVFGNHTALENIGIDIADGEFFTLLGPSGCGKTTALRIIAGLETPDAGKIYIGGRDVTRTPPAQRRVAMVFQNYALYPHMSVFENISYPLRIKKVPKGQIEDKVNSTAEKLYLAELLERMPSQISGGQQQRVAVARAMVQDPLVYLFDEPLSNLDAKLRLEARRFLKKIQKETGITAVYVTHDQTEAMAMSDRVAVLKDGGLMQVDSPEIIYAMPANVFVAGFVGNPPMNLIEGEIINEGNRSRFSAGEFSVELDGNISIYDSGKITLGIRPERVTLDSIEGGIRLEAMVEDVERLGSEMIVSLSIGDVMILSRLWQGKTPVAGELVGIFLDRRAFHIFDKKGMRVVSS
jgi:ABC-type sugar transport system ATPase subunit